MLIKELLIRLKNFSKIAIKQGVDSITYKDWYNESQKISMIINKSLNIESISIGIFLPNSLFYAISYFGVLFSNKILVPIDIKAKHLELLSTVEYCEIDMIITDSNHKEFIIKCFEKYKYKINILIIDTNEIIVINRNNNFIEKTNTLTSNETEQDVVIMLHTSGTTSNPKRVMLTNKNLICNIQSNIESLKLTNIDKVLIALPMYFGYCNTAQFLTHIYLGASMLLMENLFLPKLFFQIVENEKITTFTAGPSMLLMILKYRYSDKYNIDSLRYICFGGGMMPVKQLKHLINKFPNIGFIQTYGQTECSPRVTALLPEYSLKKIGSVGKPIPDVEVRIFDENNNCLETNQIGEIVVKGNNIMKGYYKRPEITKKVISNGWLHTGDLGYFDQEGFLYLTGRIKNIIISGGINIYPEEIEKVLLQHDCVRETIVVGKYHKIRGEIPIAKVVLNSDVTENELKNYCQQYLTDYKVPYAFQFVESIPKTYNGKYKRF